MSLRVIPLMAVTALLAACADRPTAPILPTPATKPSFSVSGGGGVTRHIVGFKANAVPADFAQRVAALGATLEWSSSGMGVAVVSGLSDAAVSQLAASSDVSDVTPDHELQMIEPSATDVAQADASAVTADAVAPDPSKAFFYARQWHMRAIQADQAWAAGMRGSSSVKVAILDTGIDYENLDTNGRVDLANSKSFVPEDDAIVAQLFPTKNPVTDLHYHGTHVASTISSNAVVGAGVTSATTLMAVKVLNVNGVGSTSRTLAGIAFATDHGADVINMSLGTAPFAVSKDDRALIDFLREVNRAILYAVTKGVTVVVSAGNGDKNSNFLGYDLDALARNSDAVLYCDHPAVICVSATGPTSQAGVNGPWTNIDAFATYSNYGLIGVDVAAPGGNGSSFVYESCSKTSLQIPVCQTGNFILGLQGTSMAAPHVSGLAALTIAKLGGRRNLGRALAVRATIQATADDLGPAGIDAKYGWGRINVARAMALTKTPPRVFAIR